MDREDDVFVPTPVWTEPLKINQIQRNYETGELIKEEDPEPVIKDEDPK